YLRSGEELQHRAGEALPQRHVQDRQLLRPTAGDGVDDLTPLGRCVGLLMKRDEAGLRGIALQTHQRRRHAVERRSRHHPDAEGGQCAGGGSPIALRTNPPARSSNTTAASFSTRALTITIASFTDPPAAAIAARARSRSTAQASITMRSPRSRSFSLHAMRSTMRLP